MRKCIAAAFAAVLAAGASAGIGVANAGEPATLTAVEMDRITAGHNVFKDHGDKIKKVRHDIKKKDHDGKKVRNAKKDHDGKKVRRDGKKHGFDFKKHGFDFKKHGFAFKKHAGR